MAVGVWIVERERPLVQVLAYDGVHIASKADFKSRNITWDVLDKYPGSYPKPVYLDLPVEKKEADKWVMTSILKTGIPIKLLTENYLPNEQIDKSNYETRSIYFDFDKENNFSWVNIYSGHFEGKDCFDLANGISQLTTNETLQQSSKGEYYHR